MPALRDRVPNQRCRVGRGTGGERVDVVVDANRQLLDPPFPRRELRQPLRGRGDHLVGHPLERLVIDAPRERVDEHRVDDAIAIAA